MKNRIAILTMLLVPGLALATGVKNEVRVAQKSATSVPAMHHNMQISLKGAVAANRMEIEKLAKGAGAEKATFNPTSNVLKVSGKSFNEEQFKTSLTTTLPTVTVEQKDAAPKEGAK